MAGSHLIQATVTAVNLDADIEGEIITCVHAMCRVAFMRDGVTYEKEVALNPIKYDDAFNKLPEVGSQIRIHFNPETGECFVGFTKFDAIISLIVCVVSFAIFLLAIWVLYRFLYLIDRSFKSIVPGIDGVTFLFFLLAAILLFIGSVFLATAPSRLDRQIRDGQFQRIPARFTGKYIESGGEYVGFFCPVYEYWIKGRQHFFTGGILYRREMSSRRLSAGEWITLYQNVHTGKMRKSPEVIKKACVQVSLFLGGLSIVFFWLCYIMWTG